MAQPQLSNYFCDFHIHIGCTRSGRLVKVTASRALTFENICAECVERKGIQVAGIIDCAAPPVIADIEALIQEGHMVELPGGGMRFRDRLTVLLGSELETREPDGGVSHQISFFPALEALKSFTQVMLRHVRTLDLSSQACHLPARKLLEITRAAGGILIPAHAFTPHKSIYGSCAERLTELFGDDGPQKIAALELGLSADSHLADRLAELRDVTFLTNSDAHSLPKIGREYNILRLAQASFLEVVKAFRREDGRAVVGNFGLDPRLGKYHRTFCEECRLVVTAPPPAFACNRCGSQKVTPGVLDRIVAIADYSEPRPPAHRPSYRYQVPLQFIPKVGPVTLSRLLNRFGSEMAVLHFADIVEIAQIVGHDIARLIAAAREGSLLLQPGGGGRYGKPIVVGRDAQLPLGLPLS